ncbi:MAG: hypothetical protein LBP55_03450 [Candidatus Adiutrix sp.]|nr:hypothetical protein [Candidatus Adiutrix sp.]
MEHGAERGFYGFDGGAGYLQTAQSPREILAEDFKSLNGGIPINGGWGYTMDEACIIEKDVSVHGN